jgi:hypothetical protein
MTKEELAELSELAQARARQPLSTKELKLLVRLSKPPKAPPPVKPPADPLARLRSRAAALRNELNGTVDSDDYLKQTQRLTSERELASLLRDFPVLALNDAEHAWVTEVFRCADALLRDRIARVARLKAWMAERDAYIAQCIGSTP